MVKTLIAPGYKTTVRKIGGMWRVSYYFPYSGFMSGEWYTWEDAMTQAWKIEEERVWA